MMAPNSTGTANNHTQANLNANGTATAIMNTATIMNTGNVGIGLQPTTQDAIKNDQNTSNQPQQNVVLINNLNSLDHTNQNQSQQITYQAQPSQFNISTLGTIGTCRLTNQLSTSNLQQHKTLTTATSLQQQPNETDQFTFNQQNSIMNPNFQNNQGSIAIHLTANPINSINETQPTATLHFNTHSM